MNISRRHAIQRAAVLAATGSLAARAESHEPKSAVARLKARGHLLDHEPMSEGNDYMNLLHDAVLELAKR